MISKFIRIKYYLFFLFFIAVVNPSYAYLIQYEPQNTSQNLSSPFLNCFSSDNDSWKHVFYDLPLSKDNSHEFSDPFLDDIWGQAFPDLSLTPDDSPILRANPWDEDDDHGGSGIGLVPLGGNEIFIFSLLMLGYVLYLTLKYKNNQKQILIHK